MQNYVYFVVSVLCQNQLCEKFNIQLAITWLFSSSFRSFIFFLFLFFQYNFHFDCKTPLLWKTFLIRNETIFYCFDFMIIQWVCWFVWWDLRIEWFWMGVISGDCGGWFGCFCWMTRFRFALEWLGRNDDMKWWNDEDSFSFDRIGMIESIISFRHLWLMTHLSNWTFPILTWLCTTYLSTQSGFEYLTTQL